jgi:hypothetical protein
VLALTAWLISLFCAAFTATVLLGVLNPHLTRPARPACAEAGTGYQPVLFGTLHPCGSRIQG